MNRHRIVRLRVLVEAMRAEIERLEWVDIDAEIRGPDEFDCSFDYCEDCHDDRTPDDDLPDETDHDAPTAPLCVECGNYGRSCVC